MLALHKPFRSSRNLVTFYGSEGGTNKNCGTSCGTNTNCGTNCSCPTNNCDGGGGNVAAYVVGVVGVVGTIVGCTFVAADADPSTPHESDC